MATRLLMCIECSFNVYEKKEIHMKEVKNKITVILKEVSADHYYTGVIREGGTSGRINLPRSLIGKRAYVVVEENNLI